MIKMHSAVLVSLFAICFLAGFFFCKGLHAAERVTFGKCMAAAAIAGHHNYHWKELNFTREDCEDLSIMLNGARSLELARALARPEINVHIHIDRDRSIEVEHQPAWCCAVPYPDYSSGARHNY